MEVSEPVPFSDGEQVRAGTLYIAATPIGNLEDITIRALRILKQVDVVACEDTRHTRKLLEHYGIRARVISYHEHNENARAGELIRLLRTGASAALVSDAGTPLISDPGYRVVREAVRAGFAVVPLPGASALLTALAGSALPTDSFYFGGFLPAKAAQRRNALEAVKTLPATLVFYEAPHRIAQSLADIGQVLGERELVVARELTKIHEEFLRGTPAEIAQQLDARASVRGEMTIVVGKAAASATGDYRGLADAVDELVATGLPTMAAIKKVAHDRGIPKREVYAEYRRAGRPRQISPTASE
ncbi:MAG TPA: 16S rRNA (cytidine(1402)-2'-O)-methyltransferase [Bryobacteraceae bacterium]|nr:16S rRNA (cytidine(1402)-2'-O)-methyltransferase [Bryobacteraceae bacterium]